jgi:septal ring factor EnvC (AmiA/AmiB activator)
VLTLVRLTLTTVAKRRKDYVELERSVAASNELLDSLASYLSTFQQDLSAVSGQVADLQSRSAGIESQLKGRQVRFRRGHGLTARVYCPRSTRCSTTSSSRPLWS